MSEAQACATCHYWEEQSERCRRYAPRATSGNNECSDERQNALWALTDAEDWCGDYESTLEEEYEDEEEEEEEDEQWEADGSPKVSAPPAAPPPTRRGLFG